MVLATLAMMPSCTRYFAGDPALTEPSGAILPNEGNAPRALSMFEGSTGRSLGWADVMASASWADAVFIGERHDDPTAHAVQLAIFEDLNAGYPGTALALEHLERDEQLMVDQYLRGEITADAFIDATESRNWAGKDTWVPFFQPMIDAARETGSPVVAANAPREFVRRAREEGHDALAANASSDRALYDLPVPERLPLVTGDWNERWAAYQSRFREIMSSDSDFESDGAFSEDARTRLDTIFLSQSTWDGTMGTSAANALERGAPKVVLCAGCFHIERDGGTVLQFEARKPMAKVLTVTVIDASSQRLRDEDRNAADVVIYGFPVERKKPEVDSAPAKPDTTTEKPANSAAPPTR